MMDIKETAKQIREILLLLLDGGFLVPIILTSIDRYGSLMVSEYTPTPGEKDHWHCEMLAERVKSELFEPPINMLFVDARGEVARVVFDVHGERRILREAGRLPRWRGTRNELTATAQQMIVLMDTG
jgi:hypothetical protein